MKAAIYQGQRDVQIVELETPVAGDNDIVVRNLYASICGTDVAVFLHGPNTGHRVTVGGEFGHEMVSQVVQVGKNVKDIPLGSRVYPYPLLAKGDPKRAGTVGGFSEYVLIPNAERNRQVYPVPDSISSKTACLIEPFTVGFRAARRSFPQKGENAIVFGAGTIGIAAAIGLKYFGCKEVMVCDHSDFRLEKARGLDFAVCNSGREDLKSKAMDCFGQAPSRFGPTADAGIYIDAAGAESILEQYQAMGKLESRIVVVAVLAGKRPVDVLSMTYSQHALIGSGGYFPEDVKDVLAMMASKRWDVESIITDEFPLEQLPQAIARAAQVDQALNVVIRYDA
ncbi:MAG: zinc-binding dehydrogenase [Candidatus Avoscillospira sp.]